MIKPKGRGYLTLNLQRMVEKDPEFKWNTADELAHYCQLELSKLPNINFLVVDIDTTYLSDSMDGNVRLVMEK